MVLINHDFQLCLDSTYASLQVADYFTVVFEAKKVQPYLPQSVCGFPHLAHTNAYQSEYDIDRWVPIRFNDEFAYFFILID